VSNDFTQVSVGFFHNCALKSDGSLACWGDDTYGQSSPPTGNNFAGGYLLASSGNTLTFVPSATQIEPQTDNTLSVDLVVDGDELYGLQLDCNIDPSVLAITGYSHGNFFDTIQRLEIRRLR